ncbi:MAG: MiaB/RimO family radical SAM methylthiotransferase [Coriobacteriaceae bacterium]|nr:MiaB/RimO family radical SAM methylthiotransferase [Coriobacteriaceae bacterium]
MSLQDASTFHIVNLGCKVNRVESDSMAAALLRHGCKAEAEEAADLVIVNTCTVTGEAEKKTRKAVRHALAVNPLARVVVTGCAAAITPGFFESLDPRVEVRGKKQLEDELESGQEVPQLRVGQGFRTRVGVKVQDGCDRACSYCIVHVARGKAWSVSHDVVVREARKHFDAGVKEVVLAGIDIGAYRDGGLELPQLADLLVREADEATLEGDLPARIRISSIEPVSVSDALVGALVRNDGRICRHLHLPVQSGSSKVLHEMNRPYSAEEFMRLVEKLRAAVPGISLTTDVIVGFPGETEADFQETCDLVRAAGFSRLHVFPYSRREGTPAAERPDQVPAEIKRERASRLRAIGKSLGEADMLSRSGTRELVLVEGATALTESYHEVAAPEASEPGALVPVVL